MTKHEWAVSDCPYTMFQFIRREASKRKLRLFAVACCRRIWLLLPEECCRKAIEVSEWYADQSATKEEISAAQGRAANALGEAVQTCRPLEDVALRGYRGLAEAEKKRAEAAWLLAYKC